ncbi:Uncharacterized protein QTN25_009331 [Entamoeba marina]
MNHLADLNTLLFNDHSHLISSICYNLICPSNNALYVKNAQLLLEHFMAHGRLTDLFVWAFKQEYEFEDDEDHIIQPNSILCILLKTFITSMVFQTKTIQDINISNLGVNFEEFTYAITHGLVNSMISLGEVFESCYSNMIKLNEEMPNSFKKIIQAISDLIQTNFKERKDLLFKQFFHFLINEILSVYLGSRVVMKNSFDPKFIDQNYRFFSLVSCIFHKLAIRSSGPVIHSLLTFIGDDDIVTPFVQQYSNNIESNVSEHMFNSSFDDYLIFNKVVNSFEQFNRTYYNILEETCEHSTYKFKQLNCLKKQYDEQNTSLIEKQQTNEELIERLNSLRKQHNLEPTTKSSLMESIDEEFLSPIDTRPQNQRLASLKAEKKKRPRIGSFKKASTSFENLKSPELDQVKTPRSIFSNPFKKHRSTCNSPTKFFKEVPSTSKTPQLVCCMDEDKTAWKDRLTPNFVL